MAALYNNSRYPEPLRVQQSLFSEESSEGRSQSLLPPLLHERISQRKAQQGPQTKLLPRKFLGQILMGVQRGRNLTLREGFLIWYHKRNSNLAEEALDRAVAWNRISPGCFFYRLKILCKRQKAKRAQQSQSQSAGKFYSETHEFSLEGDGLCITANLQSGSKQFVSQKESQCNSQSFCQVQKGNNLSLPIGQKIKTESQSSYSLPPIEQMEEKMSPRELEVNGNQDKLESKLYEMTGEAQQWKEYHLDTRINLLERKFKGLCIRAILNVLEKQQKARVAGYFSCFKAALL